MEGGLSRANRVGLDWPAFIRSCKGWIAVVFGLLSLSAVASGLGELLGNLLPHRLGQQEGVQQQDGLPGAEVDRRTWRRRRRGSGASE